MRLITFMLVSLLSIQPALLFSLALPSDRHAIHKVDTAEISEQKNVLDDLPLHVLETPVKTDLPVFVFISGDGGWNTFNESFCKGLTSHGIPVIALDSQKYFWKSKSPEIATQTLQKIIESYQKIWKRDRFVLAGYSFGANIIPFIANRLPQSVRDNLNSLILISPDEKGDFEIHLSNMLNLGLSKGKYNVLNEIQKEDIGKYLVVFGSDENQGTLQSFKNKGVKIEILQGNHHFDSGYDALVQMIGTEVKNEKR